MPILITLSAILTIVLAVYGGVVTTSNPRHRKWFIGLGVLGLVLVCAQGYYLHRDDQENYRKFKDLSDSVRNLQNQTNILMNAIRLQATLDDFKHLEGTIVSGFAHLEAVVKGQKPPSPKPTETKPLPPPIVEHVRWMERRAASTDPSAPYGLQVVLQTDVVIQPVAFEVDFDHEVSNGQAFIVGEGAYTSVGTAYSSDHRSFLFSFHSPAFTPNSSLVVSVQSKYDVRVVKIEKIQPLF
ncbi:MAG TPA: hypothetical protein VGX94_17500 [Terriglobia bacterium]|nr:hypothetical protein [Terriglobia bacterium]